MGRTWRIGEVATRTGLTRRTLRHYDDLGLLVPSARSWGDYRLYDEADLLRLLQIQNLKALGLSLPEIADALADPDLDATTTLRSHLDHLEQRIEAERRLAAQLHALADSEERSWEDVLAAIGLTQRLAHPDPTVRVRAALLTSDSTTDDLFSALLGESDAGVQEVLVWALAQRPESGRLALARLQDPDPRLRAVLVRLLAKLRDRTAVPALVARLSDPDPRVVTLAIQGLGQLSDPAAIPALVDLLATSVHAADLVDTLATFGPAALGALSPAFGGTDDARVAAADVAGRIGGATPEAAAAAAELLAPLLDDPSRSVRLAAVLALAELGTPGHPGLQRAIADPSVGTVARQLLGLHES